MNKHSWKEWRTDEIQWLKDNYNLFAFARDLVQYLPRHTYGSIGKKVEELGLCHQKPHYTVTSRYFIRVWWAICDGEGTAEILAERAGCKLRTANEALALFKQAGVIHISRWMRLKSRGHWRAVYARGEGINTKAPAPNGKRRTPQVERLHSLSGNPFAIMIDLAGVNKEAIRDSKHQEDVCAG